MVGVYVIGGAVLGGLVGLSATSVVVSSQIVGADAPGKLMSSCVIHGGMASVPSALMLVDFPLLEVHFSLLLLLYLELLPLPCLQLY